MNTPSSSSAAPSHRIIVMGPRRSGIGAVLDRIRALSRGVRGADYVKAHSGLDLAPEIWEDGLPVILYGIVGQQEGYFENVIQPLLHRYKHVHFIPYNKPVLHWVGMPDLDASQNNLTQRNV